MLEHFYQHEAIADEVPRCLKEGGGIDAVYARLCRDASQPEGQGGLEETITVLPLARTGEGTTNLPGLTVQDPLVDPALDGGPSGDEHRRLAEEGTRNRAVLGAANDATDTLSVERRARETSKRGQIHRPYRKVILEVEMFEFQLEESLQAKRATICANVEAPDTRGWRPVRAQLLFTSDRTDGPWPGWPTRKDDDDERP